MRTYSKKKWTALLRLNSIPPCSPHPNLAQPRQRVFGPGLGVAVAVEAVAVAAGGVEQELVRDFAFQQRGVVHLAADDVGLVVVAVYDERGRDAGLQV